MDRAKINEKTLAREISHINNDEFVIITAWQSELSATRNQDRMRDLQGLLSTKNLGFVKMDGIGQENGGQAREKSLLVINHDKRPDFKESMLDIARRYQQEFIIHGEGGNSELIDAEGNTITKFKDVEDGKAAFYSAIDSGTFHMKENRGMKHILTFALFEKLAAKQWPMDVYRDGTGSRKPVLLYHSSPFGDEIWDQGLQVKPGPRSMKDDEIMVPNQGVFLADNEAFAKWMGKNRTIIHHRGGFDTFAVWANVDHCLNLDNPLPAEISAIALKHGNIVLDKFNRPQVKDTTEFVKYNVWPAVLHNKDLCDAIKTAGYNSLKFTEDLGINVGGITYLVFDTKDVMIADKEHEDVNVQQSIFSMFGFQ